MTAPSTPGGLALEPATDRIHARWFPSPDATAYRIYFSTSLPLRSCGLSVEVTETAGELGGLPIATLYHLAVSAINAQGEESALCDPVSTQTLEPAAARLRRGQSGRELPGAGLEPGQRQHRLYGLLRDRISGPFRQYPARGRRGGAGADPEPADRRAVERPDLLPGGQSDLCRRQSK